ncbi:HAD-IIB family hydrolase [Nocardia iowensis]|uniref:alpha,alpha-trehalose-phosphate synthase (ADP-forming) n=1 Tax=Nocardia iowensis TaxID=204891 RepID=A0ABX8S1D7_NOCIO|nr:HAD-IIB family hydrolase [Nocardia iowensis]QXN95022.1 HAD-IIB family hydrolase [Nocardia iowensis]
MATGEGSKAVEPEASSPGNQWCGSTAGAPRPGKILVTDLDGTLLGGSTADRLRLRNALAHHPEVTVVFATGRGIESIRAVLRDPLVPQPRWIIADVGATIIDGTDLTHVAALETRLRAGWPGTERVRAALQRFSALSYQDGVPQDGRCSFHLPPMALTRELTDAVLSLGCSWQYSANTYFDVLPARANKGNALVTLAEELHWQLDSILVAGDSGNDRSMFGHGTHGVIVGNAEPALSAAVPESEAAHRPDLPGAAGIVAALQDLGWVEPDYPLVVGYHRAPVTWTPDGWRTPSSPNGILPTLNSLFTADLRAVWAAAVVVEPDEPVRLDDHDTGLPLAFLPLTAAEWSGYFHRACKEALWPVLMSQPHRLRFDSAAWDEYRAVNTRFAEHISVRAAPGATVWLHDYNLWLVPGRLRATRPDLRLGLFHHTPFPEPEVFAVLPPAAEIRASLGCLDWVGFHTHVFAERFIGSIAVQDPVPQVGVHPLGIDRGAIEALARSRAGDLRETTKPIVLSVERLDYIKAPVQKVDAIAELLTRHPELRGALRFRLVCPPPEPGLTAYDATRQALERRIGEVNHTWSVGRWQPIEYFPQFLSFPAVIDHYLAADVFWVTSLQDGMNLTAKEFIAAQVAAGRSGVLVLSRHTGAAEQLGGGALLTEPNSPADLVDTLYRALRLPVAERRARLAGLSDLLGQHSPAAWAAEIIAAIQNARPSRVPTDWAA